MLRAALKGAMLFGFGRLPGGARFYRELTRNIMGTQATHVDKLQRVWPGYVEVWTGPECGLTLEGLDVWVHESGWTPYPALISFLLTGKGGATTNTQAYLLERYLARAVNGALQTAVPPEQMPEDRRRRVEALRWETQITDALAAIQAVSLTVSAPSAVPLASASYDLCHSGGALEHYRPGDLAAYFSECFRVLRPGGIASHVLDHRDHLYHADKKRSFLAHLALSETRYNFVYGHALTYHNRLLPDEVMKLLEEAGFERIMVRRMILPAQKYVPEDRVLTEGIRGITRPQLAPRFRAASDTDLCTAAAHYLYRKPFRAL
jgi:SAM-dependent methyltransferase